MRVHTGEKPYACPICATRMARWTQIQILTQIHSIQQQIQIWARTVNTNLTLAALFHHSECLGGHKYNNNNKYLKQTRQLKYTKTRASKELLVILVTIDLSVGWIYFCNIKETYCIFSLFQFFTFSAGFIYFINIKDTYCIFLLFQFSAFACRLDIFHKYKGNIRYSFIISIFYFCLQAR